MKLLGGKWTTETRIRLGGDIDASKRLIGYGRTLLGQLRDSGDLAVKVVRKHLPDGSFIEAKIINGQAVLSILTQKPKLIGSKVSALYTYSVVFQSQKQDPINTSPAGLHTVPVYGVYRSDTKALVAHEAGYTPGQSWDTLRPARHAQFNDNGFAGGYDVASRYVDLDEDVVPDGFFASTDIQDFFDLQDVSAGCLNFMYGDAVISYDSTPGPYESATHTAFLNQIYCDGLLYASVHIDGYQVTGVGVHNGYLVFTTCSKGAVVASTQSCTTRVYRCNVKFLPRQPALSLPMFTLVGSQTLSVTIPHSHFIGPEYRFSGNEGGIEQGSRAVAAGLYTLYTLTLNTDGTTVSFGSIPITLPGISQLNIAYSMPEIINGAAEFVYYDGSQNRHCRVTNEAAGAFEVVSSFPSTYACDLRHKVFAPYKSYTLSTYIDYLDSGTRWQLPVRRLQASSRNNYVSLWPEINPEGEFVLGRQCVDGEVSEIVDNTFWDFREAYPPFNSAYVTSTATGVSIGRFGLLAFRAER